MSTIKPVGANSTQTSPTQPETQKQCVGRDSVEKSSFASTGRHPWRSFVAGDIHETGGSIPSEDLGPLMDELSNMDEFAENGLPGANSALADEAHDDVAAAAAEEQGPDLIRKSDYKGAINDILSVLILGDLQASPQSARQLQMPAVPEFDDVLFEQPKSPEELDPIIARYETARKATLALVDSSTAALKDPRLNLEESGILHDYLKLLQENLLKIEQQLDKVYLLSASLHQRADTAEAREEAAIEAENEAMRR